MNGFTYAVIPIIPLSFFSLIDRLTYGKCSARAFDTRVSPSSEKREKPSAKRFEREYETNETGASPGIQVYNR